MSLYHTAGIKNSHFGKSGSSSIRSITEPLSMDAIRAAAPSIFAASRHDSRSERYTYIPTSAILERLAGEGFRPFAVMQGGSRDEAKRGFTKHLIRLRHANTVASMADPVFSEIVLINSHDGTSSYRMIGGQFRLVCSNGLVVSAGAQQEINVHHKGDIAAQVIDGCIEIMQTMPEIADSVREMQALTLSEAEQAIFARAALVARYEAPALAPVRAEQLLRPHRREDTATDLWRTLNVTQENIVRGGVHYIHQDDTGRRSRRQTRPINGIDQNTAVNRALWQLAEEMRALKTA